MLEATRQIIQEPARAPWVAGGIGLTHRAANRRAKPLRQRLGHVTLLVLAAALNQRMRSQHRNHRLVERLGPIDYD